MDFLTQTLSGETPTQVSGDTGQLSWRRIDSGIFEFVPRSSVCGALVLSCGIHGNETAPVEIVQQLLEQLMAGTLTLRWRLLVIFGHPAALAANQRYLHSDMNRMFGGRWHTVTPGVETARTARLESAVTAFYAKDALPRWHLDLHTAIRGSYHPRFGVLPARQTPWDTTFLRWLGAAGLEALVYHQQPAGTFTHFSSETLNALSCTLELGKALPFGQNDLEQFAVTRQALTQLLAGEVSEATIPQGYRVAQQITRRSETFRLLMSDDTLNFTPFTEGTVLAEEGAVRYVVQHETEYVLFPNPHVAPGLRAGLMLIRDPEIKNTPQ